MIQHFLLTRFNINLQSRKRHYADYDRYMENRLALFNRVTVPSVRQQSDKNFRWLVFIDPATPIDWIQKLRSENQEYELVLFGDVGQYDALNPRMAKGSKAVMRGFVNKKADFVITSRLDNDDAIHFDFIKYAKQWIRKRDKSAIVFPEGIYWLHNGMDHQFYDSTYRTNMFPTVIERPANVETVFAVEHMRIFRKFKTRIINPCRMWLWNWHGTNLSDHTVRSHRINKRPKIQGEKRIQWDKGKIRYYIQSRFGVKV